MRTQWTGWAAFIATIAFGAFRQVSNEVPGRPLATPLTVLAGSDLKDVETGLKTDIRSATGLDLEFSYTGRFNPLDRLSRGKTFDLLWLANGNYLLLNDRDQNRILAEEKTMLSPVVLGLRASKAHELGWDRRDPTWKDIAEAAEAGQFTFGMTNPYSSNTGLAASIGLAAALAKGPDTLSETDLRNPEIADFFKLDSLTAASSGGLAEEYVRNQERVDGLINYESVLLSLNAGGRLTHHLTLIYPKEGIITADYPLMLLNNTRRSDYERLVTYVRSATFQTKMSSLTFRRPINPDAMMAVSIPRHALVELPFPGRPSLISALLDKSSRPSKEIRDDQ